MNSLCNWLMLLRGRQNLSGYSRLRTSAALDYCWSQLRSEQLLHAQSISHLAHWMRQESQIDYRCEHQPLEDSVLRGATAQEIPF